MKIKCLIPTQVARSLLWGHLSLHLLAEYSTCPNLWTLSPSYKGTYPRCEHEIPNLKSVTLSFRSSIQALYPLQFALVSPQCRHPPVFCPFDEAFVCFCFAEWLCGVIWLQFPGYLPTWNIIFTLSIRKLFCPEGDCSFILSTQSSCTN